MDWEERVEGSGSGLPVFHCEKKNEVNYDNCNPVCGPRSVPGTPPPLPPKRDSVPSATGPRHVLMVRHKLALPDMTKLQCLER